MSPPWVIIEAPVRDHEAARLFAHGLVRGEDSVVVDEAPDARPLLDAGMDVLHLSWSEDLGNEGRFPVGLLADIQTSCEASGAEMALPDPAWLPDLSFTYLSRRLAGRLEGTAPVPKAFETTNCRMSLHVPSAAILSSQERLRAHHLERIQGIHMAIAEKCDMGCVMCPYYGSDRSPEALDHYESYMHRRRSRDLIDLNGFTALLDRLPWMRQVGSLSIFGPGEPLRNNDFLPILRLCAERGIVVDIATNGKYLTHDLIDALPGLSLRMVILSVDAASETTYAAIKGSGHYTRLLEHAEHLREASERGGGFSIKASFVRQERNAHEEDEFVRIWTGIADEAVFTSRYFMGKPAHPPLWTAPARLPCASLGMGIHILTNGDCWCCSAGAPDTFSLGNILHQDASHILAAQRRLVSHHLDTGTAGSLCDSCEWWRQTQHCMVYENGRLHRILRPYSVVVPLRKP